MTTHAADTVHSNVLIIGAGLAGLTAAYTLRDTSKRVTIVEAGARLGGRTYGQEWAAAGRKVDMGGTWLLPAFTRSAEMLQELGLNTVESPSSDTWLTHFRDGVHQQRNLTEAQLQELQHSLEQLARVSAQSRKGLSAEEAIQSLLSLDDAPSDLIEDWQRAMQRYLAGAPLDTVDAEHLLLALDDVADPEHYHTQIEGTTQSLIDALAVHSNAQTLPNTKVVSITHDAEADHFTVSTQSNRTLTAESIILAVPLNCLSDISIDPKLLGNYADIAEAGHVGQSRKDWLVLDGVGEHFRVFGSHGPYGYFRSEAILPDGSVLAVGLVPAAEGTPSIEDLEQQVREHYYPEARIRAHVTHDWVGDELAQGTWFVPRPGQYSALSTLASGHPNLHIVGGDVNAHFPGTIEGAIVSGEQAALTIKQHL